MSLARTRESMCNGEWRDIVDAFTCQTLLWPRWLASSLVQFGGGSLPCWSIHSNDGLPHSSNDNVFVDGWIDSADRLGCTYSINILESSSRSQRKRYHWPKNHRILMSQPSLGASVNIPIAFPETSPFHSIAVMRYNTATSLQRLAKPSSVMSVRTSKDVSQYNHSPNDGVFAG